jgi:hypothetical protein
MKSKQQKHYSEMGKARAKSLSPAQRSTIAKKAAEERWNNTIPEAVSEGELPLGENQLTCVVLPDETRVINQATFLGAIGRSRSFRGGTGITTTEMPFFLQSSIFEPYASEISKLPTKAIEYRTRTGKRATGYNALLLPAVAELYLKIRDDYYRKGASVPSRLMPYVLASDILIRGLAEVGIIALVDEATGYQNLRAKNALAKILEEFIAKELRPWVKTFPSEYYENLFRFYGMDFPRNTVKKPQFFGTLTNDIIYSRLAPGVLDELKRLTPRNEKGTLKHHLHRRLTEESGHPKLKEHLSAVVALMKISPDYKTFHSYLDRTLPKYNTTIQMPLGDELQK